MPHPVTRPRRGEPMDPNANPIELTPEELAAETAKALPERAAMSTLTVSGLDAAAGTVEAVGDGVSETMAATPTDVAQAEPEVTTTDAAPAPDSEVATTDAAPAPDSE